MLLERNVSLGRPSKISPWRKSAIGTWSVTSDSTVYSIQKLQINELKEFLKIYNKKNDSRVNLSHFMGKACGMALEEFPQINSIIRFGKIYPRREISIFYHVASDKEGNDLSGTVVRKVDQISLKKLSEVLITDFIRIRKGDDFNFKKTKQSIKFAPSFLLTPIISLIGHFMYALNLWSPLLGTPKDCFGSMMITNVGSLGIQTAMTPLAAYSRVPLILSLGRPYEDAYSSNGEIKSGLFVDLCWTFDHRLMDGVIGARMMKSIKNYIENPSLIIN